MEVKLFDSFAQAKEILKPNEPRLVAAADQSVCVVLLDGRLVAFRNECPHMGAPLHQGNINYLHEIVCPLHTYRFSLATGEEVQHRCGALQFVQVIDKGEIFLKISRS
ncbi:MAG: hypothetical protein Tsb0034_29500 [Ekhidna sp.]